MLSVLVLAYQNEPDDFRGIKWGTSVEGLSDMALILDGGDLKAYARNRDKMMIADAKIDSLHYIFYKDQFYCVRIEFADISNFIKIRDEFVKMYGEPERRQHYERHFYWRGDIASITLDYDESADEGELGYKYMPVDLRIDEDEKTQVMKGVGSSGDPQRP
jgi:hypothetical protein